MRHSQVTLVLVSAFALWSGCRIQGHPKPLVGHLTPATPTRPPQQATSDKTGQAKNFDGHLRANVLAKDTLAWSLHDRMRLHHVPGVSVAIVDRGEVIFTSGYGVLQTGKSAPVNAHSLFSAGSISKIITAATVLALRDRGILDLDQDIQSYLKSWTPPSHPHSDAITLRMLLSHTAGLNLRGFEDLAPQDPLPTLLQSLKGESPAKNEPLAQIHPTGKTQLYSGGGYLLVQLILQDLTGQSFAQLAKQHVLDPLKMSDSTFAQPIGPERKNVAKAHGAKGQARALPRGYESMPELAASGLWTSAADLAKLVAALVAHKKGLSDATRRSMLTPVAPGPYALGPHIERERDQTFFYHAGANASYKAWIEGNPSTGQGLVVLTNAQHGDRLYVEIRNAVADVMHWPINRPVFIRQNPLPKQWNQQFTGHYLRTDTPLNPAIRTKHAAPYSLRVEFVGSHLVVGAMQGGPTLKMLSAEPDLFVVPDWPSRTGVTSLRFHRNARNKVIGTTVRVGNERSFLPRAPDTSK